MRKIFYLILLIIALFLAIEMKVGLQSILPKPQTQATSTVPTTYVSTTTTLIGNFTCLPHKGDGPSTMECAFGFETTDGNYGLDWADNARFNMDLPMGEMVAVTGTVTPIEMLSSDQMSVYDIIGIIKVSSYEVVTKDIPVHSVGSTFPISLGQTFIVNDSKIVISKIIEDSRCPLGVMCIQAGRLLASLSIESTTGFATSTTIQAGQSVSTPTFIVTLDAVEPIKRVNDTITDSDYKFNITVSK